MKEIVKNIIETELGRPLTIEEESIVDEHTEIVTEIYKLDKRRRELVHKLADMKDTSIKLQD